MPEAPDYAIMNQLLFEGAADEVRTMTEDAIAAGIDELRECTCCSSSD